MPHHYNTGEDYLDHEKKKNKKTKQKKSIPQQVLEDRKKRSEEGKIPMGSRSYQGKDTREPWQRGGFKSKAECDKLPEKYKKMLQ